MSYTLIPVSEILIEKDSSITTGYDFTVEDFFTFCTDDGIYVQDSMVAPSRGRGLKLRWCCSPKSIG